MHQSREYFSEIMLKVLNEALEADSKAIANLCIQRVACNKALADHPTIEVGTYYGMGYEVGLLGILNGILGECIPAEMRIAATIHCYCPKHGELEEITVTCPKCDQFTYKTVTEFKLIEVSLVGQSSRTQEDGEVCKTESDAHKLQQEQEN